MKFRPLNDRVLIKPEINETTESGFILNTSKELPVMGEVVVGNTLVKEGEKVLFSKFGYDEVTIKKETYYVVSNFNLLGVF